MPVKKMRITKHLFVRGSSNGYRSYALPLTRNEIEALDLNSDSPQLQDLVVDIDDGVMTVKPLSHIDNSKENK